jgi:tetratricopeptide (TPR) repeat protein
MRVWLASLLACWPLAGQTPFAKFGRDLQHMAPGSRAAIVEAGRVVWQRGRITAPAPEEPVIAERIETLAKRGRVSLDDPAPIPPGATIRQVLANTADGTPGEEVLENRAFYEALGPIAGNAPLPSAIQFATEDHGTLGWFNQVYNGERVVWSYEPSLLLIRIPGKKLALVVFANSPAMTETAGLQDGNIARSTVALAFFKDVALLGDSERDELIDRGLVREALDKFPELESTPDVTLLYLLAQLRLPETEASATAVIRDHPSLPTAWFYYGQYLENSKRYREAAACFEQITMHQPPWHHWTVAAAQKELTYVKTY